MAGNVSSTSGRALTRCSLFGVAGQNHVLSRFRKANICSFWLTCQPVGAYNCPIGHAVWNVLNNYPRGESLRTELKAIGGSPQPYFGQGRMLRTWREMRRAAAEGSLTVMLHGPPGAGKSTAAQAFLDRSPPGSFLIFASCNAEITRGTFEESCSRIYEQVLGTEPSGLGLIFLDEVDVVGIKREMNRGRTADDLQRIMSILDAVGQTKHWVAFVCTNCPSLLDNALARRCGDALWISYPDGEVIKDALIHVGCDARTANTVAHRWIESMSVNGWWSGAQLVGTILKYGHRIIKLPPEQQVAKLDALMPGARVLNPREYERSNAEWTEASEKTAVRRISRR